MLRLETKEKEREKYHGLRVGKHMLSAQAESETEFTEKIKNWMEQ